MEPKGVGEELSDHIRDLRRYALALRGHSGEAEDLVQDCLVQAIANWDSWQRGTNLRSWLFRIMHNLHVTAIRRRRVHDMVLSRARAEPAFTADQGTSLDVQDVLRALQKLPEAQKEAIALVALEDLSYQEAARQLDIPLGTFMSRLARGRETLRQIMAGGALPLLRIVDGEKR